MAKNTNLKPFKPGKDAQDNGRKGGIASGAARREKRAMQETARLILAMPIDGGAQSDVKATNLKASAGGNFTVEEAALLAVARKALDGDYRALEFLRDTAGEKPTDRLEVDQSADLARASAAIDRRIAAMKERHRKEQAAQRVS